MIQGKKYGIFVILIVFMLFIVACSDGRYRKSKVYTVDKKTKAAQNYLATEAGKVVERNLKDKKKHEKQALRQRAKEVEAEKEAAEAAKKDAQKKKKPVKVNTGAFGFY